MSAPKALLKDISLSFATIHCGKLNVTAAEILYDIVLTWDRNRWPLNSAQKHVKLFDAINSIDSSSYLHEHNTIYTEFLKLMRAYVTKTSKWKAISNI